MSKMNEKQNEKKQNEKIQNDKTQIGGSKAKEAPDAKEKYREYDLEHPQVSMVMETYAYQDDWKGNSTKEEQAFRVIPGRRGESGMEKVESEKAEDERTEDERTEDERTEDEGTGKEQAEDENIGNAKVGDKTLEDYLALPEGTRVELIDGVFYDMAAATNGHVRLGGKIYQKFEEFVEENGGPCVPFIAPADVQLDCDDKTVVQPDVFIVCDRSKITLQRTVGAPDLVVEVVSPSNWRMDVFKKKEKYQKAGVREYWLVFPEEKKVRVCLFERGEEKEYSFGDKVPVGIWDGRCEVDFARIYGQIRFLYE